MDEIKYKPIGVIHSPFKEPKGTPIQPVGAKNVNGKVEVFPEYAKVYAHFFEAILFFPLLLYQIPVRKA
ncbi:hypothetical protein ES703_77126 [subsurface metagenome]